MNTEEDKEENRSATQSIIEPNAESESLESCVALPSKTAEDGSGDHLPTLETKNTTSESAPKSTTEEKIDDGVKGINVEKSKQDTSVSMVKEQSISSKDKPTFVESISTGASEEFHSENQDEDLVLRWDDDEGDSSRSLKDDEVDKSLDEATEKSIEDLTLNLRPAKDKSEVSAKESVEIINLDFESGPEKSENNLNDSAEVFDLDLDEVSQKFEESLKESSEEPNTHLEVTAKPEKAQGQSAEIIKMDIDKDCEELQRVLSESTKITEVKLDENTATAIPTQIDSGEFAREDLEQIAAKFEETLKENDEFVDESIHQKPTLSRSEQETSELKPKESAEQNESLEFAGVELDQISAKFEETLKENAEFVDEKIHQDPTLSREAQETLESTPKESIQFAGEDLNQISENVEETPKETELDDENFDQKPALCSPAQDTSELTPKNSTQIPDLKHDSDMLQETLKESPEANIDQDTENIPVTQKAVEIPEINLDHDSEMSDVTQKGPSVIDLDQGSEASEVTEKESAAKADRNDFVENEGAGMDCVELKTSEDDVEDDQDDLLSEIDAQIAELGASISKAENDKLMKVKKADQSKTTANKDGDLISLDKSISSLEEVISIDVNDEFDKIATKDTQDEIAQNTKSKKESSEMEIEEVLLAEDPDLSIQQKEKEGSPDNSEVLANSTKLDHSLVGDTEIDTSCKDDTFAHDSSSSIDELKNHGVNKTNVMLEIPTQELLDLDESMLSTDDIEMSVDEVKTDNVNVSVDLTDDQEPALPDDAKKTIDKTQINQKVTSESEMTESNKSNLDDCKLTKEDSTSKEKVTDTDVEMKADLVQKQNEQKESSKEENLPLENQSADDQPKPSITSTKDDVTAIETKADSATEDCLPKTSTDIEKDSMDVQPTTSQAGQSVQDPSDDADDVAEVTDSLGLLAESSFIREDDDGDADGDDQETSDHDDDDDDFDPDDESSNQQEHSEDSTHHSETDTSKPKTTNTTDTDKHFGSVTKDTDCTVSATTDTDEVTERDDATKDVNESLDIGETVVQDTTVVDQDTANVDETAADIAEEDSNIEDATSVLDKDAADNVDQDTTEAVDEETGETIEKEFGFEISNVVSHDGDGKEADGGDIDIDDDIVCGEVEVTENAPEGEQPADVDTSALQAIPDAPDASDAADAGKQQVPFKVHTESKLRELLLQKDMPDQAKRKEDKKKLEIAQPSHEISIVDLESSSDDEGAQKPTQKSDTVTSINISKEIEVMSSGDQTSDIVSKEGETIITVPKTTTTLQKIKSRLNTSEITIKTASPSDSPTLVIPEAKMGDTVVEATKPKFGGLEVFNLDSDDEDSSAPPPRDPTPPPPSPVPEVPPEPEVPDKPSKCINSLCTSDATVPLLAADPSAAAYYDCQKKRRAMICEICLYEKVQRSQKLIEGIRNFTPLLDIEEVRSTQELVEISDSDEDDDGTTDANALDKIGLDKIPMLEQQLSEMINATWERFKMDARLLEVQDSLHAELDHLEKESQEVNAMLDSCQLATDKLRSDLYNTFDVERHSLPGLIIHDMPDKYFICPEAQSQKEIQQNEASNKRRLSSGSESQAKKPATPLTTALADPAIDKKETAIKTEIPTTDDVKATDASKLDDDKDISVVQLSAEAAPADLPPPGEAVRPPLQPQDTVFAMRHAFGSWIKARVLEVTPKGTSPTAQNFTMCRVKFENKTSRNAYKILPARCLAYFEPPTVRMTIGTRVIALFKDTSADKSGKRESFYSGVVAEVPNPVNKYRYLVFFDDGYAQYVNHIDTRLVCEFSNLVWEEVHPFSREFVKEYLIAYPERPMVRLHTGQSLKTEWNGKWWLSRVIQVDASLVQVYFEQDKRTEWIYRGSTRLAPLYLELQAAEKHRARPLPRNRMQNKLNMPYVEYTRLDEPQPTAADKTNDAQNANAAAIKAQQEAEIRRQRAVAKKSTAPANQPTATPNSGNLDAVTSRVVYYTPKNAVKPYKMATHTCGVKCRRTDVLALKDLRTYNPLAKPLLSGWERQIVRYKGHKEVMYRAPCGRRLRNMRELHHYLTIIGSDMGVDLFDFGPNTHCLAEFVLNKCIVGKKDLSHGKENVPVPCVNYYDNSLPEFCSYNTERTPTAGVPLCLDPDFLCGCDCTDDCQDKSKCACWKLTLEGARTIGLDDNVGYVYKRLAEPLPSGIYECNSRCKCKQTCLNRVAQHPLQLKLQVFKTLNRGWGIRALNDVPKGSFLCIYAGNLLTDATANLDGLNEGDEYLAELDYIEVVEQMKEGYEDDIPEHDKKLDRKESGQAESSSEEEESEEEEKASKSDAEDGDFEPGYIPGGLTGFSKRLRKRDKKKQKEEDKNKRDKDGNKDGGEDDCITISDDEELREPSSFAAQAGMGGAFISKYRSVRSLFGRDEACYIMDAKVQGNIGRYLNHSCSPNVFVQNVFVDTHDPRFPWVAFFALSHIRAGTELTWNYNYDVGSVPGKALYCYCGAPNCRGRLL